MPASSETARPATPAGPAPDARRSAPVGSPPRTRRRVLVALDMFAHYRSAIFQELLDSPEHDYLLAAPTDEDTYGTIKKRVPADRGRVISTPFLKVGPGLAWLRGTVRLALRRDLDVIVFHANPHLLSTWVGGLLARLTGKRVLFYTIGWYHHDSLARTLLKRVYYRIAHGLLLYGHWAKMMGIRAGLAPERLYVVYNCLDYDRQRAVRDAIPPGRGAEVRREIFGDDDRPVLICTSRLTPKRRLDLVLDAMARLKAEGHPVRLLLIGDGPERERLERQAAEHHLEVHFYGPCYDETVLAELIASANATVAPGMVGLTAMHSLAYGTPVITHDSPMHQSPEWEVITPGRNGGFFENGNVADLARAIREWTRTAAKDPAVRERCFEPLERIYNARHMRRAFDWAVSGRAADDLFWMHDDGNASG